MWGIGAVALSLTTILTLALRETSMVMSPNSGGLIVSKHQRGLSQSVNHLEVGHHHFQRLWNPRESSKFSLKDTAQAAAEAATSNRKSNYSTNIVPYPERKDMARLRRSKRSEDGDLKRKKMRDSVEEVEEVGLASTVGSLPLVSENGLKRKKQSNKSDASSSALNTTEARNNNDSMATSNATLTANGKESKGGVSDKKIVIIVVCVSIALVICLLSTALLIKFYWGKARDNNGGYQDVLQKDDGNSPMEEQATSIQIKDNDARGQINMFAQIDEIDEGESCPSSPIGKNQRRLSKAKEGSVENGETKPLLTYSIATPSSNMDDSDSKLSEIDVTVDGNSSVENLKVGGEEETVLDIASSPSVTEVQVEIGLMVSPSRSPEVERVYCRTGLSQSDYSISSFTSVNPSYCYGNQVAYMSGYYGYPCKDTPPTSPNYADDVMLLPPSHLAYAFPSQESDLDISVRATKDSESDEVTMNGATSDSMLGRTTGPSSLIIDNGSEFSLGVNVDDSDVANCRECDDDDDNPEVQGIEKGEGGADDVIQPVDSVQSLMSNSCNKEDSDSMGGSCSVVTEGDSDTKKSTSEDNNGTIVSSVVKSTEVT